VTVVTGLAGEGRPEAKPDSQRELGQYMTPAWIAKQLCETVQRPASDWVVLDPACGDGNLLVAAAEAMQACGVPAICERLFGIELDERLAQVSRRRMATVLNCPESAVNITTGDFFEVCRNNLFGHFKGMESCNTILSNPPYGRLREYRFFEECAESAARGTELVFLVPLAFADRVHGPKAMALAGRPMDVTTGHAIVHHICGAPYAITSVKGLRFNTRGFRVMSGLKLYEVGAGEPPQTRELVDAKPFSSETYKEGWLPCLRTGDIGADGVAIGRLWVDYGSHLAHPKEIERFDGPRLVLRRVPLWGTKQFAVAFMTSCVLCAGDLLIVKHEDDDEQLLRGLSIFLSSESAAQFIHDHRPSLRHRMSFPKISAKDVNLLLQEAIPSDESLRLMARRVLNNGSHDV
jgi:predicted RNA methylase